jgi:hypothetical protein
VIVWHFLSDMFFCGLIRPYESRIQGCVCSFPLVLGMFSSPALPQFSWEINICTSTTSVRFLRIVSRNQIVKSYCCRHLFTLMVIYVKRHANFRRVDASAT